MNLYTYILEFRNGTYITQVEANNIDQSVVEWITKLKVEKDEIHQLNILSIVEIEEIVKDEKPIHLKERQNVWCLSFTIKQGYGLVSIVKTAIKK